MTNITSSILDRLTTAHVQVAALSNVTAGDILTAEQFATDTASQFSDFRRDHGSQVYICSNGDIELSYYVYCAEPEFANMIEMNDVYITSDRAQVNRRLDIRDGLRVNVSMEVRMPLDYIDTLASMGKIVTQTQEYKALVC